MNRTSRLLRAAVAAAALTLTGSVMAQSTDFSTWTRLGDATATVGSMSLSTAATESGETSLFGGSALLFSDLEQAMGTTFASDTYEGSGAYTHLTAAAGTTVVASWTLATAEFDGGYVDRVYAVVDGTAIGFADVSAAIQTSNFIHTFTTSGTHTLGFALLDVNDTSGVSTFSVTGLAVSAVPEPTTYTLLLAGLGLVGLRARRRA